MVFSRGVRALVLKLLICLLVAPLLLPPVSAQVPGEPEAPVVLESGLAEVEAAGRRLQARYSVTPAGPLFTLAPLAEVLGGELEESLKGEGFTLRVTDSEFLLGPGSARMVTGQQILTLTQRPLLTIDGLLVPLDVLERTFGELAGYSFQWEPDLRLLIIDRTGRREVPVSVDTVHIRGTTTVVFQFPEATPRYRIREQEERVEVELLGDRLSVRDPVPFVQDPLVRRIEFRPDRILLDLVPGARAENYILRRPFRLVFDVRREEIRQPEASLPRVPVPTPREGIRTIVLDPGHGGKETGAIGSRGAVEKELTLLLARALARRLEQRLGGVRVILTRNEDANLPLATRTAIANQNKGDLFISIHLNSYRGGPASGAETYFLSPTASDSHAAAAAEIENAPGREDGAATPEGDPLFDLQLILWDLAESQYLAESQRVANLIQEELNSTLGLRNRGVKQAPFAVLVGAAMPAVLVELGFLSNSEEEARLLDPGHQAQLVEAMVRAISRYRNVVEGVPATADDEDVP